MKLLRAVAIGIALLGLCAVLLLVGRAWLLDALFTDPPPSAFNPPIYPGAEDVMIDEYPEGFGKHVTFLTGDTREAVLAFYKDTLRKDGWFNPLRVPSGGSTATEPYYPDDEFEWHQAGINGPTHLAYSITIATTPSSTGTLSVDLYLNKYDPLDIAP